MSIPTGLLKDAQALAMFSNLDQAKAEYFHQNYPAFLPRKFWEPWQYANNPPEPAPWQEFQRLVQDAWRNSFPIDASIKLISAGSMLSELAIPDPADLSHLHFRDFLVLEAWPFQQAVMWLAVETWRARFCPQCGERFVADKSSRKFCSDRCFQVWRKKAKRTWWNENLRTNRQSKTR